MNIIFMGTPDFAVESLKALINSENKILAVVTQPDKPVGRKGEIIFSPVKQVAIDNGIPVLQYNKIRIEGVEDIRNLKPDLIVTCAFGQILSQELIDIPKYGIINVHASLLPKYRGAAPIQWSILNGDKETGVSIMRTEIGIDTGDVLLARRLVIGKDETAGELFDRLALLGAKCIVDAVEMLKNGNAVWTKQDESLATHVKMIKKEDGLIDWSTSNEQIFNFVRGMNPWPCAFTYFGDKMIKVWKVSICDKEYVGENGQVLVADVKNGLIINCGKGAICVEELQSAGGKRMSAKAFLLGNKIPVGSVLTNG